MSDNIMSVSDFWKYGMANGLSVTALRQRMRMDATIQPVKRSKKGAMYHERDLVAVANSPRKKPHSLTGKKGFRPGEFVPFDLGAKIAVTNLRGVRIVGLFAGYKGGILGRLELQTEQTVFGHDSHVELARADEPVAVSDFRAVPKPVGLFIRGAI